MKTHLLARSCSVIPSLLVALVCQSNTSSGQAPQRKVNPDPILEAQTPRQVEQKRPEQKLTAHDQSDVFKADGAPLSSEALKTQPDEGQVKGFDFFRDPLNAKKPMQTPKEITAEDKAMKPKVMEAQRKLLEARYNLTPKLDAEVKMSRGKPVPVGPTAKLKNGTTWDELAGAAPADIRKAGSFPYPPLPHPKHGDVSPAAAL